MAAKVTEADSGVFKAAMAVAPVTDFRFYDAVYTERYMNLPTTNLKGYEATAVSNMTGFNNSEFLLVHGTGDGKFAHLICRQIASWINGMSS